MDINNPIIKDFFHDLFRQLVAADSASADIKMELVNSGTVGFKIEIVSINGINISDEDDGRP
jgi:hypothetical protein